IGGIISAGPAYLVAALVTAVTQSFDPVVNTAVTGVVSVITEAFFIPLSLTCYTLYYFDLRVRKEGFDLETALNQRYTYPGSPYAQQGAAPGGYYTGQQGQYAPSGYPAPQLGYGTQPQPQPQYPAYPQQQPYPQGYEYPQQSYTQPQPYVQPEAPSQGAPTLPSTPGSEATAPGAETPGASSTEMTRVQGLGFSTPSISEQAAQPPGTGTQPQIQDVPEAGTPETGKLDPPRQSSDTPTSEDR
ncbi:MAG: hypothetical protein M3328_01835, partial [Chloroflexota bacterium]|nr:hypothetical protein [Chloroflexota bacterium]